MCTRNCESGRHHTPFVVYADAETILKPVEVPSSTGMKRRDYEEKRSKEDISTKIYQEHVPYSFCYKIVSTISDYESEMDGEKVAPRFIESLQYEADKLFKEYISNPIRQPTLNELSCE